MLPKSERLSVRDIASLSSGRSVFGGLVSIRYVEADKKKFSVSVSKKVAKRAVDRNRMRRRVYSALLPIRKNIAKNVFVMVMPKKECDRAPIEVIKKELVSLFERAKIY